MVSNEQIDEIIEKTDIVDLVSEYVNLEKAGSSYRGLCPFHNEKTPSFMVSPSKKIAKCMGCGGGGSPISFLMQIKNISFIEAVSELAAKAGIKIDGIQKKKNGPDYSKYYSIMDTAAKFFRHSLLNTKSGEKALEYLHKRGIDDKQIEAFEIGFAPNLNQALYNVLKESGFNEIDMSELGLIKSGNNGFYDLFKNRIMFPIKDEQGHVVAFSGRIYVKDDSQPKYVNSPETIIFKKGNTLFHLSDAISNIRKTHRVVLCEGQIDVISATKSGIDEAICSMGTALTANQVKIISKYATEVVLVYDGDNAGQKAMVKAIKLIEAESNLKLRLVSLPSKMDPDEFVSANGPEAFLDYFNKNQLDSTDFMLKYATKDKNFSDMSEVEAAKLIIFDYLKLKNSQVITERVLEKLSDIMVISKASLSIDFSKYCNTNQVPNFAEISTNETLINNNIPSNEFLSSAARCELRLINYGKISKDIAMKIEDSSLLKKPFIEYLERLNQKLWSKLVDEYYITNDKFDENIFLTYLKHDLYNCYVANIESLEKNFDKYNPYNEKDMNECIKSLVSNAPKKEIDEIDKSFYNASYENKKELLNAKIEKLKELNKNKKESRK